MVNHITQVWTAWISISCLDRFYIAEYGAPLYVPRAHIFAIFYVLNSMLVYVKWFSVAQQLVHDLEERACRMCIVCLSGHNLQACMLHIRGPCTVKSGLCGLRLCAVFTQMTLSQKLKLPRYTQLLSLDALNLVVVYIQPPVGPYYQAIATFLRLHDHPMDSGLEHCLFNCRFSFVLLCR